ncbi:hypothetical protein BMS3Abin07_00214 [bacterium BMS3Abin07]|nr:hypothetical protein BMS3Abin07_00214 [bacterium BMS3Abin07]
MFDGLWIIEFESVIQSYGKGVVVLNNGRLLGGDDSYYYSGTYRAEDNKFEGTATIIKHNPHGISVFGNIGHFELTFTGEIDEYRFSAVGHIINNPEARITMTGIKKEDM